MIHLLSTVKVLNHIADDLDIRQIQAVIDWKCQYAVSYLPRYDQGILYRKAAVTGEFADEWIKITAGMNVPLFEIVVDCITAHPECLFIHLDRHMTVIVFYVG